MTNVPDIVCLRPCVRARDKKCIMPREWRDIGEDAPWGGHYCVDRFPDSCRAFKFDITKELTYIKSIDKRIRKLYKIAISLESDCTGVGSLTPTKDIVTEIIKIVEKFGRPR